MEYNVDGGENPRSGETMNKIKKPFGRIVSAFKGGPKIHINRVGKYTIRIDILAGKGYLSGTDISLIQARKLIRALNDGLAASR